MDCKNPWGKMQYPGQGAQSRSASIGWEKEVPLPCAALFYRSTAVFLRLIPVPVYLGVTRLQNSKDCCQLLPLDRE